MRLTRATELAAEFPSHVCTAWMGHTKRVAEEHYWRTTDDDFQRATSRTAPAKIALGKPLGKTAQQAAAAGGTDLQTRTAKPRKPLELPCISAQCEAVPFSEAEGTGLELSAKFSTETVDSLHNGAQNGAVTQGAVGQIISAWPVLPEIVRAEILAIVKTAASIS